REESFQEERKHPHPGRALQNDSFTANGRVDFFVPNAIDLNEVIHFNAMIGVITERVEDLGQTDVRQMIWYVFGPYADLPQLDNRPNWHASVVDHGLPGGIGNNMGMISRAAHGNTIPHVPD